MGEQNATHVNTINKTETTPAQQARQRIEAGAARADGLPALQDTFVDERNDVISVINELEDQLDRHQEIRETLERELTGTTEKLQSASTRTQELEWQGVTLRRARPGTPPGRHARRRADGRQRPRAPHQRAAPDDREGAGAAQERPEGGQQAARRAVRHPQGT